MQDQSTGEVFARKIICLFGDVTKEDIVNEARVTSELCQPQRSNTVVEVMRYAWLPGHPSYYYIDMEYCSETLEHWIRRRRNTQYSGHDTISDVVRESRNAIIQKD